MNILRKLKQTAVHWAKGATNGEGFTSYSPGVEIPVRWEGERVIFINQNGEEQFSNAVVYMLGSQAMNIDDKLFLGLLTDLDVGANVDPRKQVDAYPVAAREDSPNLRNTQTLRKATL